MLVKTLPNAFVETSIFSLIKLHLILLLFKASLIFHLYYNLYQRDTEEQIWIDKNESKVGNLLIFLPMAYVIIIKFSIIFYTHHISYMLFIFPYSICLSQKILQPNFRSRSTLLLFITIILEHESSCKRNSHHVLKHAFG